MLATHGCRAGLKSARTRRPKSTPPTSTRSRSSRTTLRTSRTASTASRPRASGSCRGTAIRKASRATFSAAGRSRRRSSTSPDSPGTCPAMSTWHPALISTRSRCAGKKDGQFIYGVKPCIGQRNNVTGRYDLLSVSQAYGCTEPYFLIREAFQRRTAMFRYDEFRRPSFWQVDVNFAKTTPITAERAVPGASGGVQPLQQPDVRRAAVQPDDDVGRLRPYQPQHDRSVELPAVHPAGVPTDLLSRGPGTPPSVAFPAATALGSRL